MIKRLMLILGLMIALTSAALTSAQLTSAGLAGDGREKSVAPLDKNNPLSNLWSGFYYAKPETRAIQQDDFENPGMLYVEEGGELWQQKAGPKNKSCASCHKNPAVSMREAGARYPVYYAPKKRLINLEQRINLCRKKFQKQKAYPYESRELLALTAFVRHQAKGVPVRVKVNGPAKPFFEKGKAFYYQRRGQLDMACNHCHESNYGKNIRSLILTQGHSNGFPTYRMTWQGLGSLHRRFRGCNIQVRSKPYPYGAPDYVNLELYLNWRGAGLEVETPAVRP